jgi:hypothetical protein
MRKRDKFKAKLKALTNLDMLKAMKKTLQAGYTLFKGKLADYGLHSYKESGPIIIYFRLKEKFSRLENLMGNDELPNFEAIEDTIQDIFVLAATLVSMLNEQLIDIGEMKKQYKAIIGEEDDAE